MSQLDFSEEMYKAFAKLHPDDCAAGESYSISLSIEDYVPNSNGDGFALSYLLGLEYKNTHPYTSPDSPILFSVDKTPSDADLSIGDAQSQTVKIINMSEKA